MAERDDESRLRDVIVAHIPTCVQRLLDVECGQGALGAQLKRLRPIVVIGLQPDADAALQARKVLDRVFSHIGDVTALDSRFDCAYVSCTDSVEASTETIQALLPTLNTYGFYLVHAPSPQSRDAIEAALAPLGLVPYLQWRVDGPVPQYLVWFSRADYNPLNHAREQLQQGRPSSAYQILLYIPEAYLHDVEVAAAIAAEKLLCLLIIDRREGEQGRLTRFARAQYYFYDATARVPGHPVAFECQERFWRLLGDTHMAECLRTIYAQLHPDEDVATAPTAPPKSDAGFPRAKQNYSTRVLLLTHELPDFGLDILYDGLCRTLGQDHVTEYPWKKSLHGQAPDLMAHYPCTFDYPSAPYTAMDILARAAEGAFDVILCGAIQPWLDSHFLTQLAAAAPSTPWVIVDQRDEPDDPRHEFIERLPHARLAAFFKREWLRCAPFDGSVYALPFAYPDNLVPATVETSRSRAVFWAGHGWAGMRRAYLEHLANALGMVFPERLAQEEYRAALLESRIGLNFFGFGFDTVRYWELPAHGCMLLANRLPIRIPHNFQDGKSAVFFDDLVDLEEKLRYYLAHDAKAAAIAHAGRACLLKHHTSTARAQQLLGTLALHGVPAP